MDLKPMKNKSRFGVHTRSNSSGAMTPKKKSGKLDDVRSNGWLDAMKGSSPPRKITNNTNNGSDDIHYRAWMNNYPSALDSFEQIRSRLKDRKIVVFLDYDGTLSPIVDDPDRAFLSADMRAAVKNIAKYYPTAIISGRNRDAVFKLVGLTELYYAGSHGMDIMFRKTDTASNNNLDCIRSTDQQGEELSFFQPARKFLPMIGEVYKLLVESTNDIKGAKVEDHKFCVSVHYRNVDEDLWPMIAKCVHDVLENYPLLKLTYGRKVFEVRPQIDWNKGKAVEFLLESLGFKNSEEVFPIYIGDDRTDEDAFKVLRDANLGFGILVSAIPKESNAAFSLGDTSEVQQFLEALVRMQEEEPLESIKGA